jgi:hypothetical protein
MANAPSAPVNRHSDKEGETYQQQMREGRGAATNPPRAYNEGPRAGQRGDGERESSQSPGSRRPICPSYFHYAGVGNALR